MPPEDIPLHPIKADLQGKSSRYEPLELEEFPDFFGELRPSFAPLEGRPFAPTLPLLNDRVYRVVTDTWPWSEHREVAGVTRLRAVAQILVHSFETRRCSSLLKISFRQF